MKCSFTGRQLRHAVTHMIRDDAFDDKGDKTEWFQFSKGFFCEFDRKNHSVISLKMNGKVEWKQNEIYSACQLLGITNDQITDYFFAIKVQ